MILTNEHIVRGRVMKMVPIVPAESLIPQGLYCYESIQVEGTDRFQMKGKCPFHSINPDEVDPVTGSTQMAGYCSYLKKGDWMDDGTFLLWDGVKECGVKEDEDE